MREIHLRYGRTSVPIEYDEDRFQILGTVDERAPLSDIEIGERLDAPVDSLRVEEIVGQGERVLFVVPDATRRSGCGQMINLLVRRLIANGTAPFEMAVIFATGIHRPVTEKEKHDILTPFIAQRIKTLSHDPRDLMQIVKVGETSGGIPVELNRALIEYDRVIVIGSVTFHYFAGYTGGRKLICPGLASARTVSATHKLAFDCELRSRRAGVGTGILDGNPVHEAFVEAASFAKPSFAINSVLNESGDIVDVVCGDWIVAHREACEKYGAANTIQIGEKRDLVIVSCGGFPHDINMIQAHKALEAASHACTDGGTIVLLAECPEGMGRKDFLDWFSVEGSQELAEKLCEKYQVNGQTAWSLLRTVERFDVRIISSLSGPDTQQMRMTIAGDLNKLLSEKSVSGCILPNGARNLFRKV